MLSQHDHTQSHIHIVGICGTFMGSLALLARQLGYTVTGCDANVYPPMSTQLENAGITLIEGFSAEQTALNPDQYIIGNVVSRGNPLMEKILNDMLPFTSGPEWLASHVLQSRWVMAVSGTHGKTTTASMLTWILTQADMAPGYLIGGVPNNFETSADLGQSDFFVIEADEYDSAFFDKRSKFIHYRPHTLVINNMEYDHADIFPDLAAIQRQFHHLVRTVPQNGLICFPHSVAAIDETLDMGCWSDCHRINERNNESADTDVTIDWEFELRTEDGSSFDVYFEGQHAGHVSWGLTGLHNVRNGMSAIAAARHVGVVPELSCDALNQFDGVKRRLELIGEIAMGQQAVSVYDDFAHHPTAIDTTLRGLRSKVAKEKIIAIIEPRSNTMKQGVHQQSLIDACGSADEVVWLEPDNLSWPLKELADSAGHRVFDSTDAIVDMVVRQLTDEVSPVNKTKHHIVIMSNGGFNGIHQKFIDALSRAAMINGPKSEA